MFPERIDGGLCALSGTPQTGVSIVCSPRRVQRCETRRSNREPRTRLPVHSRIVDATLAVHTGSLALLIRPDWEGPQGLPLTKIKTSQRASERLLWVSERPASECHVRAAPKRAVSAAG